jgi:polyphenol oxidase
MDWRERDGVRWLESALPGARAAFSARTGGASGGPYESLNLGILTGDDRGAVLENRDRLTSALGLDRGTVVIARQVHGAELIEHGGPQEPHYFTEPREGVPEVDGHVVREPGLAPLVFVADCLPVVLAGPRGLAVLHCGWRGLAGGIIGRGAEAVGATAAAVGPGIGSCCYEVGEEVLDAFGGLGEGVADGRMLDLAEAARRLLARAGVEEVEVAGHCTSCEPSLFFSHRRDEGNTGRQAGVGWLEKEG